MKNNTILIITVLVFGVVVAYFWRAELPGMGVPVGSLPNPQASSWINTKTGLIRVSSPEPSAVVKSPLVVTGEARGNWYFEASFPAKLLAPDGTVLAQTPAQATEDWMTSEFVPFVATLNFTPPVGGCGTLVLERDNPSGLPEHADELRMPVCF